MPAKLCEHRSIGRQKDEDRLLRNGGTWHRAGKTTLLLLTGQSLVFICHLRHRGWSTMVAPRQITLSPNCVDSRPPQVHRVPSSDQHVQHNFGGLYYSPIWNFLYPARSTTKRRLFFVYALGSPTLVPQFIFRPPVENTFVAVPDVPGAQSVSQSKTRIVRAVVSASNRPFSTRTVV